MALNIQANGEAKLKVNGLDTELASIYSRITFDCSSDGNSMLAFLQSYGSESQWSSSPGSQVSIEGLAGKQYYVDVREFDPPVVQSLQSVHDGVKAQLEELGYIVEIVDL